MWKYWKHQDDSVTLTTILLLKHTRALHHHSSHVRIHEGLVLEQNNDTRMLYCEEKMLHTHLFAEDGAFFLQTFSAALKT